VYKLTVKSILIIMTLSVIACNSEKNADDSAPKATEPVIMKEGIQTLNKTQTLDQATEAAAAEQRQKIDAATQ
jgi:hypothetical protein